MKRVPRYQVIDMRRMFGRVLLEHHDRNWYVLYWLKLPVYGMAYNIAHDEEQWSRRVLFWHGKEGFQLRWHPCPTGALS